VSLTPLSAYLAPVGLLRALSARDPDARLAWRDDGARWEITSDALPTLDAVAAYLAYEWTPAPAISPWNGRSGWWGGTSADWLDTLRADRSPRLAPWREAVRVADAVIARQGLRAKPEGAAKRSLVRALRSALPDAALPWLDACWSDGEGEHLHPRRMLGLGGAEASYEYASHALRRLLAHVAQPEGVTRAQLAQLVTQSPGDATTHEAVSGGVLAPPGGPTSPLTYLLAIEGAGLLGASQGVAVGASGPWQCALLAGGLDTLAPGDTGLGEVWLPYWTGDASLAEVSALLAGGWPWGEPDHGLHAALAVALGRLPAGVSAVRRVALVRRHGRVHVALDGGLYRPHATLAQVRETGGEASVRTLLVEALRVHPTAAAASRALDTSPSNLQRAAERAGVAWPTGRPGRPRETDE